MDARNHLKTLLQFQLASDASTVKNLPYCLSTLTADCLRPSSHLAKWTTRINALLHSKEAGARWGGLCLAYRTSLLSQLIMIDCAQTWIGVALPVLSRNEPVPVLKAALRLLRVIFTTAMDITEFQRQVSVPNVVKFSSAIIPLAENQNDTELRILCTETLTRLVTLYPSAHRALSANLSGYSLRYLNGSTISPTNAAILDAASQLYSVLPLTGGKVGAVNLWRTSVDETIAFGWEALLSIRTTFPLRVQQSRPPVVSSSDPQVVVPLSLDRLRCSVTILCNLLSTTVQRPVQVPIGHLVKFATALLACTREEKIDGFVDPFIRSMEEASAPEICSLGCELLTTLAEKFVYRLDAHSSEIFTILASQLEQKPTTSQRLALLKAVDALLKSSHPLDSTVLTKRMAKATLPSLVTTIATSSFTPSSSEEGSASKTKNGKRKARTFEGDEVFKSTREVVCPTAEDEASLLTAINVLQCLFKIPSLSSSMRSVIARIVTAILITLPRIPPSSLSQDPQFSLQLTRKIESFGLIIGSGTTSAMGKALPFVIEGALTSGQSDVQSTIELLLHPRVPPLVRSMPHLEALSLFRAEESHEEAEILTSLAAVNMDSEQVQAEIEPEDISMMDATHSQKAPPRLVPDVTSLPPAAQDIQESTGVNPSTGTSPIGLPQFSPSNAGEKPQASNIPASMPALPPPLSLPAPAPDEEDEEMPAIDLESDSEAGEDD